MDSRAAADRITYSTLSKNQQQAKDYQSVRPIPSQQSAIITLQQGQRYYIEALQKEGGGGDHLVVAWKKPGSSTIETIPGANLIAFEYGAAAAPSVVITSPSWCEL